MRTAQFRTIALTGLLTSIALVGGYVLVVALRGRGTHLGGDTIGLIYASIVCMFAASIALWFRDWRRQQSGRLTMLTAALSLVLLGSWMYLRHSGRVITYKEMIDFNKSGPTPR
jgi:hypothetical protein